MSRSISSLARAAMAVATLTLLASTPARADYYYWYADSNFGHADGELTTGLLAGPMPAPAWACGRRFFQGAELQWIGSLGQGVGANNGGQEVNTALNAHFGTGPGCKPRPRLETHPGGNLIAPRVGAELVKIDPDAGSYWIDKDGGWPACNCAAPVGFKALVADLRWAGLLGSLKDVLELMGAEDAARPTRSLQARQLGAVADAVQDLQRSVAGEVSKRRLTVMPTIESAARQLEDLSMSSLAKAAGHVQACRAALDRAADAEAYRACDRAGRAARQAQQALEVVLQEMR